MSQPSQGFHMPVVDPPIPKKPAEGFRVELGVVPGAGNAADVDHSLHTIGPQQPDEFIERPRGMAHGENSGASFSRTIHFILIQSAIDSHRTRKLQFMIWRFRMEHSLLSIIILSDSQT